MPKKTKGEPSRYADAPYDVGKGKPPKKNQFAQGNKGGPGRRKGSRNRSDYEKVLATLVTVKYDSLGRPIRKRLGAVIDHQLAKKAAEGDLAAIRIHNDYRLKLAAIQARNIPQLSDDDIRREAKKKKEEEQLSGRLGKVLQREASWRHHMLLEEGGSDLAPWVYEAIAEYKEKYGPRLPPHRVEDGGLESDGFQN